MKRILIASALFGLAFAAQAQSSATVTVKDDADASATTTQASADGTVAANQKQDELTDRNCLRQTGSLITARSNTKASRDKRAQDGHKCISANGRSYSREDIDRTGTTDLNEALRRLDPAVH